MKRVRIKLAEILEQRGYSHREFAKLAGIRHPTISEMCKGATKSIPIENLEKICNVLDMDITDILMLEKEDDP